MTEKDKKALIEMVELLSKMTDEEKRETLAVLNGIQIGKQMKEIEQTEKPA